ncbi:MAG TPA: zf-HC2 domain-containing protein [Gemmatimonadaceae bacterium]|nr:zf-HC2 domain-containing protein [Gemmatimonadaceae bacterium]
MNDCANAGVRDQLPELLHDRLDAQTRAAILAHVNGCVDCRAELELLRDVRGMLAVQAPRVDVNWVAAALPKPPRQRAAQSGTTSLGAARRHRVWSDWRVAAAVTLLIAGGSSVALLDHGRGIDRLPDDTVQLPPVTPPAGSSALPSASASSAPSSLAAAPVARTSTGATSSQLASADDPSDPNDLTDPSLGASGRLENLNAAQLKKLLGAIDQIEATPITEPEPVSLRLDNRASTQRDEP